MEKFYQMVLLLFPLMDFFPLYIEKVITLLVFLFCCFLLFPFFQVVQLFLFFLLFLSRGVRHHFYLKQLLKTFFIRWMNADCLCWYLNLDFTDRTRKGNLVIKKLFLNDLTLHCVCLQLFPPPNKKNSTELLITPNWNKSYLNN